MLKKFVKKAYVICLLWIVFDRYVRQGCTDIAFLSIMPTLHIANYWNSWYWLWSLWWLSLITENTDLIRYCLNINILLLARVMWWMNNWTLLCKICVLYDDMYVMTIGKPLCLVFCLGLNILSICLFKPLY